MDQGDAVPAVAQVLAGAMLFGRLEVGADAAAAPAVDHPRPDDGGGQVIVGRRDHHLLVRRAPGDQSGGVLGRGVLESRGVAGGAEDPDARGIDEHLHLAASAAHRRGDQGADGLAVGLDGLGRILESGMEEGILVARDLAVAPRVLDVPDHPAPAQLGEDRRLLRAPHETGDLMPRRHQLPHHRLPDVSRRSGQEDSHLSPPVGSVAGGRGPAAVEHQGAADEMWIAAKVCVESVQKDEPFQPPADDENPGDENPCIQDFLCIPNALLPCPRHLGMPAGFVATR